MTFHVRRARFKAEIVEDDLIVVEDLNGEVSVTNDIERVIATIQEYRDIGFRKMIYRDSMGLWCGVYLVPHPGHRGMFGNPTPMIFGGFISLGAVKDRDVAIAAAMTFSKFGSKVWRP